MKLHKKYFQDNSINFRNTDSEYYLGNDDIMLLMPILGMGLNQTMVKKFNSNIFYQLKTFLKPFLTRLIKKTYTL